MGKTLTAEILAESSGLPLYKVGISDIGTRPYDAERGLRRLFDIAEKWNAILLMLVMASILTTSACHQCSDEADVFLDSRGTIGEAEIEKNAMVAGKHSIKPQSFI